MSKSTSLIAGVALFATLGVAPGASPAEAAAPARTLTSGVYVTPAGAWLQLPSYAPVAKSGTYKTSGRPKTKACSLRAVDTAGQTVANAILMEARSATVRIPTNAAIVEVSGPCKWRRS